MPKLGKRKNRRQKDLALIHMGAKALGLDEIEYREKLEAITGKRSAKEMTATERAKVIFELTRDGGISGDSKTSKQRLMEKISALLADMRLPAAYGDGCAKQMFRRDRVKFCSADQLRKIVAALTYHQKQKRKEQNESDTQKQLG